MGEMTGQEATTGLREADLRLARRCVDGDREAQRALFRAHGARVHHILYRIMGSNRDMDDVLQECFLAVFRSLGNYRGEAGLGTWVDRVTTRTAFKVLSRRPKGRVPLEVLPPLEDGDADPERRALLREMARRLYAVLDELPPQYRLAYVLHVVDGRPVKEVAELTDSTVVAAKNRVWRARRRVEERAAGDPLLAELVGSSAGPDDDGRPADQEVAG
jgi:RNA polymerase sigma-70 factor (ECF subfamily)